MIVRDDELLGRFHFNKPGIPSAMRGIRSILRMSAGNKKSVSVGYPLLLFAAQLSAAGNKANRPIGSALFRHALLDILLAIAINLLSMDPQAVIRHDFGNAVDPHAPPHSGINHHQFNVGILPAVPNQWLAFEG